MALPLLVTASKGTEPLVQRELNALGAKDTVARRGGIRFEGSLEDALRVCMHARVAMRVLMPLAEIETPDRESLYDAAKSVAWEEHLTATTTFAVDATLKDSAHNHSGAAALKVKDAIVDRLREKFGSRPDVDTKNPAFRVVAHLHRSTLMLSLDVCGDPLNQRGYRLEQAPAPLKETLAAGVLKSARFEGEESVVDPMCGSGTLAIEAALIAMRRAPNKKRHFAIERWPAMRDEAKTVLAKLRDEATAQERPAPFPIFARDRDGEAVAAARANVRAAGLEGTITVEQADALTGDAPPCAPGLIVTNPPYGDRLKAGGQKGMKSFYWRLSENLFRWEGWRLAVLSGNEAFESAFHRRPNYRAKLWNGPIECDFLTYRAESSTRRDATPPT